MWGIFPVFTSKLWDILQLLNKRGWALPADVGRCPDDTVENKNKSWNAEPKNKWKRGKTIEAEHRRYPRTQNCRKSLKKAPLPEEAGILSCKTKFFLCKTGNGMPMSGGNFPGPGFLLTERKEEPSKAPQASHIFRKLFVWWRKAGQLTLLNRPIAAYHCWQGLGAYILVQSLWKTTWSYQARLNVHLSCEPAVLFLDI